MKMISRITNGIYLQQGLIDGSIPVDDLLLDLLKLGSAKLSQLLQTDATKFRSGINAIKAIAENLRPTDAMEKNLKFFFGLDSIRKTAEGLENVDGWSDVDVKKITTQYKDREISFSLLDSLIGYVDTIAESMDYLSKTPDYQNAGKVVRAYSAFYSLKLDGQNFNTETKELSHDHVDFKSVSDIKSTTFALALIFQAADAVSESTKYKNVLGKDAEARKKNFENFEKIHSFSQNEQHFQDVNVLKELILNRRSRKSQNQKYSFPFMECGMDIIGISDDLNDPWVKKVIKSSGFSESLKAMAPIGVSLKAVNSDLAQSKNQSGLAMIDVFKIFDHVISTNYDLSRSDSIASELSACEPKMSRDVVSLKEIQSIQEFAMDFDKVTQELKSAVRDFINIIIEQEFRRILEDVVSISTKCVTQDSKRVETTYNEFKVYNDLGKFESAVKNLKTFADKITILKTSLKNSSLNLHNSLDKIQPFQTAFKSFEHGFSCLKEVKNTTPLIRMILLTQEVSSLTKMTEEFKQIDKYVDKVAKVIPEVEKMKASLEGMKGNSTPSTDALKLLSNREVHSQTIGRSTQGIVNMATAIKKKESFESLGLKLKIVQEQMSKVKLDQKDRDNLNSLMLIEPSIAQMYQSLETWKSSLKDTESTVLVDHSPIFTNAKVVSEIDLDFYEIGTSLGMLITEVPEQNIKDKLTEIRKTVDEMDSARLKFSDYSKSFGEVKGSLSALDLFFAGYGKKAPLGGLLSVATTTLAVVTSTASNGLILTLSIGIPVAILAGIAVLILLLRLRKKRKARKELNEMKKRYEKHTKAASLKMKRKVNSRKQNRAAIPLPPMKARSALKLEDMLKEDSTQMDDDFIPTETRDAVIKDMMFKLKKMEITVDAERKKNNEKKERQGEVIEEKRKSSVFSYFWDLVNWNMKTSYLETKLDNSKKNSTKLSLKSSKRFGRSKKTESRRVVCDNKFCMILSPSPKGQSKDVNDMQKVEQFWQGIKQEKVKQIVMLCDFKEFFSEGREKFMCDEYIPKKKGDILSVGDFKIKCIDYEKVFGGQVIYRILSMKFKEEKEITIEHMQYIKGRNDKSLSESPLSSTIMAALVHKARIRGTTTLVHCEDGISRSGVFAFVELLLQEVKKKSGLIEYHDVLSSLRKQCPNAVNSDLLFGFSVLCVFVYLYDASSCELIEKLRVEFKLMYSFLDEMKTPEDKKESEKIVRQWVEKTTEIEEKRRTESKKLKVRLTERQKNESAGWVYDSAESNHRTRCTEDKNHRILMESEDDDQWDF